MDKKNILLFIDSLGYGGAQNQFVCLASLLKEKGYQLKILVVYNEYDFYLSSIEGIDIICNPALKKKWKRLLLLPWLIKKQKPDVVIAYLDSQCILACVARLIANFKLIVSDRNTTQSLSFRERVKFYLYRKADYVVPNSYSQGSFINRHFPNLLGKICIITNVIDLSRFYPLSKRHKNEIPQILSAGRSTYQKNYLGMIEAVRILKSRGVIAHFNWYTEIIEYDTYYKEVEKKIIEYNLTDFISVLKPTKDIGDKYRESDFFWIASYYEGFPNVLCEAMACGLPVAFSDTCDNPIIAKEDLNGVMFSPYNAEEMANKLQRLINMTERELDIISKRNVERIKELCSEETFINNYINLIEN